jgi:hypothetical protein
LLKLDYALLRHLRDPKYFDSEPLAELTLTWIAGCTEVTSMCEGLLPFGGIEPR